MDHKELLLAISDMMDHKLDSIHTRMDTFDTKLDAVEERLSGDIRALDAKIDAVEEKLSADISALDAKIDAVEEKLSADISILDAKIDAVDRRHGSDIRTIKICLENVVVPRLNHIEQCYLATSERYMKDSGRIEGLLMDVQVIKSIVQDHSIQLQKIS